MSNDQAMRLRQLSSKILFGHEVDDLVLSSAHLILKAAEPDLKKILELCRCCYSIDAIAAVVSSCLVVHRFRHGQRLIALITDDFRPDGPEKGEHYLVGAVLGVFSGMVALDKLGQADYNIDDQIADLCETVMSCKRLKLGCTEDFTQEHRQLLSRFVKEFIRASECTQLFGPRKDRVREFRVKRFLLSVRRISEALAKKDISLEDHSPFEGNILGIHLLTELEYAIFGVLDHIERAQALSACA